MGKWQSSMYKLRNEHKLYCIKNIIKIISQNLNSILHIYEAPKTWNNRGKLKET